jgi:hypothetical protein
LSFQKKRKNGSTTHDNSWGSNRTTTKKLEGIPVARKEAGRSDDRYNIQLERMRNIFVHDR